MSCLFSNKVSEYFTKRVSVSLFYVYGCAYCCRQYRALCRFLHFTRRFSYAGYNLLFLYFLIFGDFQDYYFRFENMFYPISSLRMSRGSCRLSV